MAPSLAIFGLFLLLLTIKAEYCESWNYLQPGEKYLKEKTGHAIYSKDSQIQFVIFRHIYNMERQSVSRRVRFLNVHLSIAEDSDFKNL